MCHQPELGNGPSLAGKDEQCWYQAKSKAIRYRFISSIRVSELYTNSVTGSPVWSSSELAIFTGLPIGCMYSLCQSIPKAL